MLSTKTARVDRTQKLPVYARERIAHVWLVDPRDRTVEVFRLGEGGYLLSKTWGGEDGEVVLEPFDAVSMPSTALWGRRRRAT